MDGRMHLRIKQAATGHAPTVGSQTKCGKCGAPAVVARHIESAENLRRRPELSRDWPRREGSLWVNWNSGMRKLSRWKPRRRLQTNRPRDGTLHHAAPECTVTKQRSAIILFNSRGESPLPDDPDNGPVQKKSGRRSPRETRVPNTDESKRVVADR